MIEDMTHPRTARLKAAIIRAPNRSFLRSEDLEKPILEDSEEDLFSSNDTTPVDSSTNSICHLSPDGQTNKIEGIKCDSETPNLSQHVFSNRQKLCLAYIVALAGIFSPLSSNIYFPVMDSVASGYGVSIDTVALTVTVYMIVQAVAPSFWGPLADVFGRRPMFIGTFLVYLSANVGLVFVNNFAGFMVLRGIQAFGGSSVIAISSGVVGDITDPAERGGLLGLCAAIRMLGQAVGPVFGGILSQYLGYKSIFWFLFIAGTLSLCLIVIILPETLASIAGNGTVRLEGFQKPLLYYIKPQSNVKSEPVSSEGLPGLKVTDFFSPLRFLFEKDVIVTLFFGGVIYTVWSMVTSSFTSILDQHYHLNNIKIGLCFIPNGAGCMIGSTVNGRFLDYNYRVVADSFRQKHDIHPDTQISYKTHEDFPVEAARLKNAWVVVGVFVVATALYGWSIHLPLACPLVLQFFIGFTATAITGVNSILMLDLYPGKSASAIAVNNLIRCSMGAVGVSVVQLVIERINVGWAFFLFACITLAFAPAIYVEQRYGGKWRRARDQKLTAACP